MLHRTSERTSDGRLGLEIDLHLATKGIVGNRAVQMVHAPGRTSFLCLPSPRLLPPGILKARQRGGWSYLVLEEALC